jgi:hypothetical protein
MTPIELALVRIVELEVANAAIRKALTGKDFPTVRQTISKHEYPDGSTRVSYCIDCLWPASRIES